MAGEFSLAMAQLKMRFLLELTNLGLEQGNKQARAWASWYKSPAIQRLRPHTRIAITDPGVIAGYMAGDVPALSDNPHENEAAMKLMEHLAKVRREDPASFDQMIPGTTLPEGYVLAYIDHQRGRREYRGYKHERDLTSGEKYSMGYPLTARDLANLRRMGRPIG